MDLLRELNERQKEAVLHEEGPLLVLAGAGSGKTRVLIYRIAHLIHTKGIDPWHILAITFTNKAAEEMKTRAAQLLGMDGKKLWISTFHAGCSRILRQHGERLGYRNNFIIYDEGDQLSHIKTCIKELGLHNAGIVPQAVQAILEKAKNQGVSPEYILQPESRNYSRVLSILNRYQERLREYNAFDFGDLINCARVLFETHPDVLVSYQRKFQYILVDEYQDTNRAQHLLLKTLVPEGGNLCVVGDDDQSIYRWRGAQVSNLLDFETDFLGARVITLDQNYRSTKTILKAASSIAMGNPNRHKKELWTENKTGDKIQYFSAYDPGEEAEFVAREIHTLIAQRDYAYRDIGVFFRTNAQSRPFEEAFLKYRISYAVIGSVKFYERAEIKDLIAYLRLLYNPDDSASLRRILNRPPRGIGDTTQSILEEFAKAHHISLWAALEEAPRQGILPTAATRKIDGFRALMLSLHSHVAKDIPLAQLIDKVIEESGYRNYLECQGAGEAERRLDNIEEMIRTAQEFKDSLIVEQGQTVLGAFLERVALVSDVDTYEDKANLVSLMTLHCAKGLEFPVVFLTGLEEGILPHERSGILPDDLAEERRLCYVGMTRAKTKLYLTRVLLRTYFGEPRDMEPSRFLEDIPAELIQDYRDTNSEEFEKLDLKESGAYTHVMDYGETQINYPRVSSSFKVGDHVEHPDLGLGIVRKVEGKGEKEKITVQFQTSGIRKLMVRYAPLNKVS
jgi:DNA helicase-2/ATP-dependent DNA helicase PcrA